MTKQELEARIRVLEAELALLKVQVAQRPTTYPVPYIPSHPWRWYGPVWCGTSSVTNKINAAGTPVEGVTWNAPVRSPA